MGNKRLLIYCPVFLPETTGYTHAFEQLITNLLQGGFKVDVLTPQILGTGEAEPFVAKNFNIYRYKPTLKVWGFGLFYEFYKQAQFINKLNQQHAYQLLFIETGDVPLLSFFLSEFILKKTVVRFHSTSDTEYLLLGKHKKYKLRRWFWRFLSAKKIKHVCATNQYHLDYALNNVLNQPKLKSKYVVTNAIDVNTFDLSKKAARVTFLMLGRMDEEGYKQKGFNVLLKALPLIKDDMLAANAEMVIIGAGSKFSNFKQLVEQSDFVTLKPNLPHQQLLTMLQQSHVVLLPSLYEGVSMFALEALANGNAVIFSKTGGLIEMVDANGYLVEPGNAVHLADAIRKMVQHKNLGLLQKKSQQIAQSCFSKEIQLNQFEHLIREVELC
jgi:glycosyltransferase involved in cell wall biosynthesis